ncbi:hypothetical protein HYU14_02685 [Candidatus Woesearchaeota archaeon]|nr:hypothetical protein [Candidatus Woesearchaeota archaeon]
MIMTNTNRPEKIGEDRSSLGDSLHFSIKRTYLIIVNHILKPLRVTEEKIKFIRRFIFDEKNQAKFFPQLIACETILNTFKHHKKDERGFVDALLNQIGPIRESDPELAERATDIASLSKIPKEVLSVYNEFMQSTKEKLEIFLRSSASQITEQIGKITQKDLRLRFIQFINAFREIMIKRGQQRRYIFSFEEKVKRWRLSERYLSEYIEEAKHYQEILKSFANPDIDSLLRDQRLEHFSLLKEEILFLKDILRRIEIGKDEAEWKSFLQVYGNMKHIYKRVFEYYHDPVASNELQAALKDHASYGQQPLKWEEKLKKMIYSLENSSQIIYDGQQSLLALFNLSNEAVETKAEKSFNELKDSFLQILKRGLSISRPQILLLRRIAKDKKKELIRKLYSLRKLFLKKEDTLLGLKAEFMNRLLVFNQEVDFDSRIRLLEEDSSGMVGMLGRTKAASKSFRAKNTRTLLMLNYSLLGYFTGLHSLEKNSEEQVGGIVQKTSELSKEIISKGVEILEKSKELIGYFAILDETHSGVGTNV